MATELNQNECEFPNDYEFPVCGGWCEGPNRCMKIGGSKHLNAGCYSYSAAVDGEVPKYPYGQVPKHPCIWHKTVEIISIHQCVLLLNLKEKCLKTKKNGCVLRVTIQLEAKTTIRRRKRNEQQRNKNIKLVLRLPSNTTKTLLLHLVTFVRVMVLIVLLLLSVTHYLLLNRQ